MSVIHNFFVKFLQTTYFYTAESARKIDAQLKYKVPHMIFGVEKSVFGKKSRKSYWTLIFYHKISGL